VLVLAEQFGNGPGTVHIGNAKRDGLVLDDATSIRTRQLTNIEAIIIGHAVSSTGHIGPV
jgi:hypothetical protein